MQSRQLRRREPLFTRAFLNSHNGLKTELSREVGMLRQFRRVGEVLVGIGAGLLFCIFANIIPWTIVLVIRLLVC